MKKIKITVSSEEYVDMAIEQGMEMVEDIIYELLTSPKLLEYFKEHLKSILEDIARKETFSLRINDVDGSGEDLYNYFNSFGSEISGNELILYNDAVLDTSTKVIKDPVKKANYPLKLSLAQIIEYGTGIVGSETDLPDNVSWQYDVNNHGQKGWWYVDKSGQAHFTKGFEGRLIFLKLILWIRDNASELIENYLKENM